MFSFARSVLYFIFVIFISSHFSVACEGKIEGERVLLSDPTKGLTLTLSPQASPEDCAVVGKGLFLYNMEKVSGRKTLDKADEEAWGAILTIDSQAVGETIGLKTSGSLILDLEALQKTPSFLSLGADGLLQEIIRCTVFPERRAHQIFTETNVAVWWDALSGNGFKPLSRPKVSFVPTQSTPVFYKESLPDIREKSDFGERHIQWSPQPSASIGTSEHKGSFGFFVRSTEGIKGGLLGTIERDSAIHHVCVDKFWIDESLRGSGLGKKLMDFTEDFARDQKINHIHLGTNTFQAPGFYLKMGYTEVLRIPNFFQLFDGTWSDNFTFEKII